MTDQLQTMVIEESGEKGALFGPEQLSLDEGTRLLTRGPGWLVLLMGERGAGKTTLCTELYERQRRPGSNVNFAGSWTLLAFERLAHHRRLTGVPQPRASAVDGDGRQILHLALSAGEAPLHLLLTDLPGETFRRLADNQVGVDEFPWLPRADKIILLVDGERLLDTAFRSMTLTRVHQLLERLRSAGLPRADSRLALLVTKWDLVRADPAAVAYWEPRERALLEDLRAFDDEAVAVRVSCEEHSFDDGFAELRAWLLDLEQPSLLGGFGRPRPALEATEPAPVESAPDPLSWPTEPPPRERRRWWRR